MVVKQKAEPQDAFNAELIRNVYPPEWQNPDPQPLYHLVVLGAGTAGLVSAAIGAEVGARVALVERHRMGGDCLNYGCVPSKAIIRSSRAAFDRDHTEAYGLGRSQGAAPDFGAVMERMRCLRSRISAHDSVRRFSQLGIDVFLGEARFTSPCAVAVGGRTLRFKRAIVATGARPAVHAIEGLAESGYLTNETIFSITERPGRLIVIGGGPIGCELAQAFRRLGSKVTVIDAAPRLLSREDSDAAAILTEQFRREGIDVKLGAKIVKVDVHDGCRRVHVEREGQTEVVAADQILVAVGRVPNVEGLGLEAAGVRYERHGVTVNDALLTSNPSVFAAGDVCLGHKFTHTADFAARIAVRNALVPFLPKKKFSDLVIPWCIYTDPEIAHVGAFPSQLDRDGVAYETVEVPLAEVDRAILDGEPEGFLKVHVTAGDGTILGATLVARHAGEMISELTLAMTHQIKLGKIGDVIHPYPTQAEAIRKAADRYNRNRLTPRRQKILKWIFTHLL